ncbi:MAG: hypothetical protein HKP09_01100 [Enterobacterales bacterium]|nr:hypothetical protein [Enterobacterales bacterium]
MAEWFNARCIQLRDDLNNVSDADDADELKLKLIRVAMRESSLEMFRRAAQNSKANLEDMGEDASNMTIEHVEKTLLENIAPEVASADIMPDLNNIPGIPEAMAKAEEKFRTQRPEIVIDDETNTDVTESEPLSASDLNLDKFLKKPEAEKKSVETEHIKVDADKPEKPSPKARIKINSSILRRD